MLADLLWRPQPSGNSLEWTIDRLTQSIRFGLVAAGERLPSERDLAERLHVGRETVREAIRTLREAGLVRTTRGRSGGTFVADGASGSGCRPVELTGAELSDLLTHRFVLETGAVRQAAMRPLDPATRSLLADCLESSADPDPGLRRRADARLHLMLAAASGSPTLVGALADVHSHLDALLVQVPESGHDFTLSDLQHRKIVEAVLAGDRDEAFRQMENHCAATSLLLSSPRVTSGHPTAE